MSENFKKRKESRKRSVTAIKSAIKPFAPEDGARGLNLWDRLLVASREFAESALDEIAASTGGTAGQLDAAVYDLKTAWSTDVSAILLAKAQRETAPFKQRIEKAEMLIEQALPRIDKTPCAIGRAYLNKLPVIRVVPYANVALVGLPYTITNTNLDLLAIPHEVGHFVYWSRVKQLIEKDRHEQLRWKQEFVFNKVAEELQRIATPNWIYEWREELFADVYATCVAGPLLSLDFQDHILASSAFRFTRNDHEHPIPIIRPFIHTAALRLLGHETFANELDTRWLDEVRKSGLATEVTIEDGSPTNLSQWPTSAFGIQLAKATGSLLKIAKQLAPETGVWKEGFKDVSNIAELEKKWSEVVESMSEKIMEAAEFNPIAFAAEFDALKNDDWPDLRSEAEAVKEFRILRNLGGWKDGPHPPGDSGP